MEVLVRNLVSYGETYAVVRGDDGYLRAINHKYLDNEGRLTKQLNGLDMFVSTVDNTLDGMIRRIQSYHEFQQYIRDHEVNVNDPDQLRGVVQKLYHLQENKEA